MPDPLSPGSTRLGEAGGSNDPLRPDDVLLAPADDASVPAKGSSVKGTGARSIRQVSRKRMLRTPTPLAKATDPPPLPAAPAPTEPPLNTGPRLDGAGLAAEADWPTEPLGHDGDRNDDAGAGADADGDDNEDVDEKGDRTPGRSGTLLTKQLDIRLVAVIVVVVALAAGAYVLGQRQGKDIVGGAQKAPGTTVFKVPKDFVPISDPETGVQLSVPNDWVRYSIKDLPDKAIRLSAGIQNSGDSVVVRVNPYSTEITEANLPDQKNVFDQLLTNENIEILVNQPMKLGGLPALFYVYRFKDQATGKAGVHAHFFVFQGRKMVSMVFQALPEDRYALLASTFDKVANSLKVAPGPLPAFLEPSTAPATTVPGGPAPSTSAPAAPPTSAPPSTG
ncbi:MAG: hypothetical protein ABIS47_07575 [Acidimicrobiales bacterium]